MYYVKPAKGYLTSLFSNSRKNPVLGIIRPHQGIDISGDEDNTIIAAASGIVRVADNAERTGFGKYIVITHPNGQETVYAHLSKIDVKVGQHVRQSEKIGIKGTSGNSTGLHLHFEVSKSRWTNEFSNKFDPLLLFVDPVTEEIQKMLNKLGYGVLKEDGIYGDGTISAVTKYQKDNKLGADGVAGRTTFTHMEKACKDIKVVAHSPAPSKPSQKGDEDELKFSSPTLQKETEFSLQSKSHREMIVAQAIKAGANKAVWEGKLKSGEITDGDLLGLAVKYLIDTNK